jgi:hypothetical protein
LGVSEKNGPHGHQNRTQNHRNLDILNGENHGKPMFGANVGNPI